ncbi:MAG: hypothetical protein ACOYB3_07740 [Azonexus sp.]
MTTPTETLLDHLREVRDAFTQAGGALGAWSILETTCPAVTAGMAVNTFRVNAPIVLAVAERLCPPPPAPAPVPKNFEGWTVSTDARGYHRLHRKIRAKLVSLYVGKDWSESYARKRIASRAQEVQTQEATK